METGWTVKIWGVRGSMPAAGADFLGYGGNTSCISVDCGGAFVIFDAGSGLGALEEVPDGRETVLLLSHLHLDHLLGLFSFQPLLRPGPPLHIYGEAPAGGPLSGALGALFGRPYWPVGLEGLARPVAVHELRPGDRFAVGGVEVSTLRGCHPGGALYYRLDGGGHSMVYALDCELTPPLAGRLAGFARGCGLLVWDASFTAETFRPGWGHSTWEQGIGVRRAAGAKRVLMAHFSPRCRDGFLREQEALAAGRDPACIFAKEGMELRI